MNKSILIVDDSETDRYIAKRIAERSKLFDHVYCLNDGEEAYNHFKNQEESKKQLGDFFPPSIVILDINMPKMNGFEFLENFNNLPLKNKNETYFVAMLSSSNIEEDKKRALEYPFVEIFLSKPFKKEYVELLSEKVNELMATKNG